MHDIFYVDYGNKAMLSSEEVSSTLSTIWSLPPMAKPFRLMGKIYSLYSFVMHK